MTSDPVVVPGELAGLLDQVIDAGVATLTARGAPAKILDRLAPLRRALRGTAAPGPPPSLRPTTVRRLTVSETAQRLGWTTEYVRLLCRNGELPATHVAGRWTIDAAIVDAWLAAHRCSPRATRREHHR